MKIKSSVHSHVCSVRPWFALSESFFSPSWWFFFLASPLRLKRLRPLAPFDWLSSSLQLFFPPRFFNPKLSGSCKTDGGDVIISVQTIRKMHHSNSSTHMPAHGRQEEDKLVILCRARQHLHKQKHVWTTAFNYPKKCIACGCHVAV